jgi:SulP family sulfate permease
VDFSILTKTWTYAKADFVAVATTILLTLGLGVEAGVSAGVILSILPASLQDVEAPRGGGRPCPRHRAFPQHPAPRGETDPEVVTLRIDESPLFRQCPFPRGQRLKSAGVTFHLSEVKGPVMDRLLSARTFSTS